MEKTRDEQGRFVKKPRSHKKKKVCTGCGRYLWLRDFYKLKDLKSFPDGRDCRCKECRCKSARERYNKRKIPDGIRLNDNGVVVEKKNGKVRIYWGDMKMQDFKRMFPYNTNEDVAIHMGCSVRTVVRRAKELGLQKDPEWLLSVWKKNCKIASAINTLPSTRKPDLTNFIEGGRRYRYQKKLEAEKRPL